jgi:TadE-like protein
MSRAVLIGAGRRHRADRGSVTAEFALLMPGFAILLAAVLGVGTASIAQVRCIDAARSAARLAARGEASPVVLGTAKSLAPVGAAVGVARGEGSVRVSVHADVPLPLPGRPRVGLDAVAVARLEQSLASPILEPGSVQPVRPGPMPAGRGR